MLEVFDSMAVRGSADARSMATGVSEAMICTLTGLASASRGLYPVYYFRAASAAAKPSSSPTSSATDMRTAQNSTQPAHADETGIDLAPMLDFVLNLLIFFIITAVFVKEVGLTVSRPNAANAEKKEAGNILDR